MRSIDPEPARRRRRGAARRRRPVGRRDARTCAARRCSRSGQPGADNPGRAESRARRRERRGRDSLRRARRDAGRLHRRMRPRPERGACSERRRLDRRRARGRLGPRAGGGAPLAPRRRELATLATTRADAPREDVDTVSFGCFRTDELRRAGGWANEFHANQDFELNHRLRRAGGRVVFDPAISSVYRPRESIGRDRASVLALRPLEVGDARARANLPAATAARPAGPAGDRGGSGSAIPLVSVRSSPHRRLRSCSRCRVGPSPRRLASTGRSHDDAPALGSRSALRLRAAARSRPRLTSPSPIERPIRAALARRRTSRWRSRGSAARRTHARSARRARASTPRSRRPWTPWLRAGSPPSRGACSPRMTGALDRAH